MVSGRSSSSAAPSRAQRHLDVARAELDLVVEIAELALVPHLDGAVVAILILADADALGIVAIGAEGRGSRRADPFRAALVPALLLGEALAQQLHQLVEPAQGGDLRLLLLGEEPLDELPEPFLGNLDGLAGRSLDALEAGAEDAVELVEMTLILHQGRAREIVEILDRVIGEPRLHRLDEREILAQGDRDTGLAQREEELGEHGGRLLPFSRSGDVSSAAQRARGRRCARAGARPARS